MLARQGKVRRNAQYHSVMSMVLEKITIFNATAQEDLRVADPTCTISCVCARWSLRRDIWILGAITTAARTLHSFISTAAMHSHVQNHHHTPYSTPPNECSRMCGSARATPFLCWHLLLDASEFGWGAHRTCAHPCRTYQRTARMIRRPLHTHTLAHTPRPNKRRVRTRIITLLERSRCNARLIEHTTSDTHHNQHPCLR